MLSWMYGYCRNKADYKMSLSVRVTQPVANVIEASTVGEATRPALYAG